MLCFCVTVQCETDLLGKWFKFTRIHGCPRDSLAWRYKYPYTINKIKARLMLIYFSTTSLSKKVTLDVISKRPYVHWK